MKVLELLEELEDVVESSAGVPLTGKILVDAEEILEIIQEIRVELPDEIKQAAWIKEERQRIIGEAHHDSEVIINEAKQQAEVLVNNDDIISKAKQKADQIIAISENTSGNLKIETFTYLERLLNDFQNNMQDLNASYIEEIYARMQQSFGDMMKTIGENRGELKEMLFRAKNMELDDPGQQRPPESYPADDDI